MLRCLEISSTNNKVPLQLNITIEHRPSDVPSYLVWIHQLPHHIYLSVVSLLPNRSITTVYVPPSSFNPALNKQSGQLGKRNRNISSLIIRAPLSFPVTMFGCLHLQQQSTPSSSHRIATVHQPPTPRGTNSSGYSTHFLPAKVVRHPITHPFRTSSPMQ